ncbi:hypothetical protein AX15_004298 [Amanita polypyramis BW_CC]|nr:hypothetical protein AX15_004298 [Amanita polypyramis BW_CC]
MSTTHIDEDPQEISDPMILAMLKNRYQCPRFRILVIGRANAGKTTILEKMCGVARGTKPVIYDRDGIEITEESQSQPKPEVGWRSLLGRNEKEVQNSPHLKSSIYRGLHDIEHQITYPGSNFIFHDSRGFESGSANEIKKVRDFIKKRSASKRRGDRLHAIWYCIPMDNPRPLPKAELNFFNKGTGKAPLVAVFTKFEGQVMQEYSKLPDNVQTEEAKWEKARMNAEKNFQEIYLPLVWKSKYPPKTYVQLEAMNLEESNCLKLTEKTAEAIDVSSLQLLFVSAQMDSLALCVESALQEVIKAKGCPWSYVPYEMFSKFPHFWNSNAVGNRNM